MNSLILKKCHAATSTVLSFDNYFFFNCETVIAQKVNDFPKKADPLHVKVDKFDKLMLGNHWNEEVIMQYVIFPPAGLDRPIMGPQADCLDPASEILAAYSHKYAITKTQKTVKSPTGFLKQ